MDRGALGYEAVGTPHAPGPVAVVDCCDLDDVLPPRAPVAGAGALTAATGQAPPISCDELG